MNSLNIIAGAMSIEDQIIRDWQRADSTRELKFLAVRLVEERFHGGRLAERAERESGANRLGYLAEASAEAAELNGEVEAGKRLRGLAELMSRGRYRWTHLNPITPAFGRRIIRSGPQGALNKKWKVWSTLDAGEVADWMSLYSCLEFRPRFQRSKGFFVGAPRASALV